MFTGTKSAGKAGETGRSKSSLSEKRMKATVLRREQIRAKLIRPIRPSGEYPRFVADVMLGRLAKWLRIAGFDVLYSNRFSDDELITISNRERRILLSRDTGLLIRRAVKDFIFLESQNIGEQIRQVFDALQARRFPFMFTRCIRCNEALVEAPRESLRDRIPAFVHRTQNRFKVCPKCGKVFWAGTHRSSAVRTLENLWPHSFS